MSQWFTSELNEDLLGVLMDRIRVPDQQWAEAGYFSSADGHPCFIHRPDASHITLHGIALSLSRCARWGGRTRADKKAYSVAQHSVWVSRLCKPENALAGLLHDAPEAFLHDIISPFKRIIKPLYHPIEHAWALQIGKLFGVGDKIASLPVDVKCADLIMLEVERYDLMNKAGWESRDRISNIPTLVPVDEFEAYCMFTHRYQELTSAR